MGKILVTAFSPFGLRGLFTKRNASRQVLRLLKTRYGEKYEYLVLPVDSKCETLLGDTLRSADPAGILSMGELLTLPPGHVRLEPAAVLAPGVSVWPRLGRYETVASPWAQSCEDSSLPETTGIGLYYCNRVYLTALSWANAKNRPAAFLHIPVAGSRERHLEQVMGKLEAMRGA